MLNLKTSGLPLFFSGVPEMKTWTVFTKSSYLKVFHTSHPAISCSKLTIETAEQGVKYVQS